MTYQALRCACRYARCPDWHVSSVADVQGVHFTKKQAEAVADLLNAMEVEREEPSNEVWNNYVDAPDDVLKRKYSGL